MTDFATINAGHKAFAAMPAVTIRVWRVSPDNPRSEAQPVNLPAWAYSEDEGAVFATSRAKDMIFVQVRDDAQRADRRYRLSTYIVRQKSARWVNRNGQTVREHPLYPDLIGRVCLADGFAPITPADVVADPVGIDRTLVEQQT